jgi:hypothetical protein
MDAWGNGTGGGKLIGNYKVGGSKIFKTLKYI